MGDSTAIDAAHLPRPVVLVAEDDDGVREVTVQMLADAGLEVLCARDGREAVERVRSEGPRICAVVLDLMMPVMDGRTALREIRRLRPDLPVVVTSGLDGREVLGRTLASSVAAVLRKPYRMSELVEAVQRAAAWKRTQVTSTASQGGRS